VIRSERSGADRYRSSGQLLGLVEAPLGLAQHRQVIEGRRKLRVAGTKGALLDGERASIADLGFSDLTSSKVHCPEVALGHADS
jgi:hypothetical protein